MPGRSVYPTAHDEDDGYGGLPNSYVSGPGPSRPNQQRQQGYQQYQQQQQYYGPPAGQQYYAQPPPQQQYYAQPPHNDNRRTYPSTREYYDDDDQGGGRQAERSVSKKKQYDTEPAPSANNIHNRKCHDIIWLILFLIVIAGMAAVGYYSVRYGNVDRLIYGRDSDGNLCGAPVGVDSARDLTSQRQLLYFVDDASDYHRCVASCPTVTALDSGVVCRYDITPATTHAAIVAQVEADNCTYTVASESVLNRCVPLQLISDVLDQANATYYNQTYTTQAGTESWAQILSLDLDARDAASVIFQDLATNWWVLLVCVGASFVLSYGYLLLLQFFAGFIVWFTIFVVLLVGWVLAAYFIYNYVRIKVLHQGLLDAGFTQIDSVLYNETLLLALGCAIGGISLILTIIILFLIKRIRLAVHIIEEASRAVRAMPFITLFPFFKYAVILIWMAAFVAVMALLATSGTAIATAITSDLNNELEEAGRSYSSSYTLQYLQIFFTFGFLWVYNWLIAIGQCTVAGGIATWYWARDKDNLPSFPVIRSLGRTLRYHLGSLAFGSLLIAIVQIIRLILLEMQNRVKGTGNKVAQSILCCLQCCFKCIESLLKMLTKNAYVEIAVYGYSFCTAARMAMQLIASNVVRLVVVHKVSTFLIFVGRLAIVFITTLGGLALLVHLEGGDSSAAIFSNYAVPAVFIILFSFLTSSAFLSTFSMAITTIFISFCEDSQRNDGSRERPYFMTKNLRAFVDAHAHEQQKL